MCVCPQEKIEKCCCCSRGAFKNGPELQPITKSNSLQMAEMMEGRKEQFIADLLQGGKK